MYNNLPQTFESTKFQGTMGQIFVWNNDTMWQCVFVQRFALVQLWRPQGLILDGLVQHWRPQGLILDGHGANFCME